MIDRKKVIRGLQQHCYGSMFDRCGECPYYEFADEPFQCRDTLLRDTFAMLKEQEAWHKTIVDAADDMYAILKDRPEVVRCLDCKHFLVDETCGNPRLSDQEDISTNGPDWYCADGERV